MLFNAYIDDSADRNRERIVLGAAIIGGPEEWRKLGNEWNARLKIDEIAYFKASHCRSLNGQFHKWRNLPDGEGKVKADKLRDDLDFIIRNSRLMTLGVVLPIPFYRTMKHAPHYFGEIPDNPYHLAFEQTIAECGKAMRLMNRNNMVSFAHDDGDDFPILHELYKLFKKHPKNRQYAHTLRDFVPLDDKTHPPVQAADLAADVVRQYAEDWAVNPSEENLRRLRSTMYKIVIWNERMSELSNREDAPAKATYVVRGV